MVVEAALPDKAVHLNHAKRALIEVLELDATIEWLQEESKFGHASPVFATTNHNNGGFSFNGPPVPLWLRGESLFGKASPAGHQLLHLGKRAGTDRKAAAARTRIVARPRRTKIGCSTEEVIQETDPDYAQPALLPFGSSLHTAGDVWLAADAQGSENVRGFLDNTQIFDLMAQAIEGSQN